MERATRGAAQRARELIAKGFRLKDYERKEIELLTEEEEDNIDAELLGIDNEEDVTNRSGTVRHEQATPSTSVPSFKSYGDEDEELTVREFQPCRPPGPHLGERVTRVGAAAYCRAIDFFQLFFTQEILQMLCTNTNLYGWLHVLEKPTYGRKSDGTWQEVEEDEMKRFLGLVIMMGFIVLPDLSRYWSQASLYQGGWANRFMSRNRFKALLAMLHVSNPDKEDESDKLTKVRPLLDHMKEASRTLYQPERNIAIDERMVRSKGHSGIRQYMPNKPVRFGYKLWCLCESHTGYTLDFDVYTGRRVQPSQNGLGYDVVTKLLANYQHQNYIVYMDNFYTSVSLVTALLRRGVYACGTTLPRRKGFPQCLRDQTWVRQAKRGQMRYKREEDVLCIQWQDTKPVCVCSTCHRGHDFVFVQRRTRDGDRSFRLLMVRKPKAIHDYNQHMGGVDLADQMLQNYNVLLKSARWWKTIFFHLVDVAVLNSFIMFRKWQEMHPNIPELQRASTYSHLHFREELVRQLGLITEPDLQAAQHVTPSKRKAAAIYHSTHMPKYTEIRRNCRVCYLLDAKEVKTNWMCADEACGVYVCLNKDRNCMTTWHSPDFDHVREDRYRHTH